MKSIKIGIVSLALLTGAYVFASGGGGHGKNWETDHQFANNLDVQKSYRLVLGKLSRMVGRTLDSTQAHFPSAPDGAEYLESWEILRKGENQLINFEMDAVCSGKPILLTVPFHGKKAEKKANEFAEAFKKFQSDELETKVYVGDAKIRVNTSIKAGYLYQELSLKDIRDSEDRLLGGIVSAKRLFGNLEKSDSVRIDQLPSYFSKKEKMAIVELQKWASTEDAKKTVNSDEKYGPTFHGHKLHNQGGTPALYFSRKVAVVTFTFDPTKINDCFDLSKRARSAFGTDPRNPRVYSVFRSVKNALSPTPVSVTQETGKAGIGWER